MPGFPVLHHLLLLAQTCVHWVGDAIQPSHPLSPPSPPAFNLSQHQDQFQWVGSPYQLAKVLELQLQHQSFQWIFRVWFPLGLTGFISFRIDLFDFLAVQGTLKSLIQHHNLKASILWRSAIFPVVGLVYPVCESHKASRERDEDSDGGKSKPKEQRTGPQQSRQARGKAGCGQSARAWDSPPAEHVRASWHSYLGPNLLETILLVSINYLPISFKSVP